MILSIGANSYTPELLTRMSVTPKAFFVSANKPIDVCLLRHVRLHRHNGTSPAAQDVRHHLVRSRFARSVIHHHRRPRRREVPCEDAAAVCSPDAPWMPPSPTFATFPASFLVFVLFICCSFSSFVGCLCLLLLTITVTI